LFDPVKKDGLLNNLNLIDALQLAITVLRDSSDTLKMPSGITLGAEIADLHSEAAEILEHSLQDLDVSHRLRR
jgi:hypothetical protein